jgi:hypothetical protein
MTLVKSKRGLFACLISNLSCQNNVNVRSVISSLPPPFISLEVADIRPKVASSILSRSAVRFRRHDQEPPLIHLRGTVR